MYPNSINLAIWVVVKIMVLFWVPIIIRHLLFRVPKKGTIILTTTHIGGILETFRPKYIFNQLGTWIRTVL